jgi:hypothetical protein
MILKRGTRFRFKTAKVAVIGRYSRFFFLPIERFDPKYVESLCPCHKVEISPDDIFVVKEIEHTNNGATIRFKLAEVPSDKVFILFISRRVNQKNKRYTQG